MRRPHRFSKDGAKEAINLAKHGISLGPAEDLDFGTVLVAVDDRRDYGEVREIALGFIGERLHVLVFTMRVDTCHAISLRKANRREIRRYVEDIQEP